jgi:hypothetical protein
MWNLLNKEGCPSHFVTFLKEFPQNESVIISVFDFYHIK